MRDKYVRPGTACLLTIDGAGGQGGAPPCERGG